VVCSPVGAHVGGHRPRGPAVPGKGSPGLGVPSPRARQAPRWGSPGGISPCCWCHGRSAEPRLSVSVEHGTVSAHTGAVCPRGTGSSQGIGAEEGLCHPSHPAGRTRRWGAGAWHCPGTAGDVPRWGFAGEDFQACQAELCLMLCAGEGL